MSAGIGAFAAQMRLILATRIPTGRNIGGYHGTSIEGCHALAAGGVLPASKADKRGWHELYFYPNPVHAGPYYQHGLKRLTMSEILAGVKCYARTIAQDYALISKLGLKPSSALHRSAVAHLLMGELEYPSSKELRSERAVLNRYGVRADMYDSLCRYATGRYSGVVLSLTAEIFTLNPQLGDPGEGDLKIRLSDGLQLKFIAAITPLGVRERLLLDALLKR